MASGGSIRQTTAKPGSKVDGVVADSHWSPMGFPRLGAILTQGLFNGILDRIEAQNAYQHGRGVLTGLVVSAGSGETIDISGGWMVANAPALIAGQTAIAVPTNTKSYVFVDSSGSVTTSASPADPGGEIVCLGSVTTDGANVIDVSEEMRTSLARFSAFRVWEVGAGVLIVNTDARTVQLGGSFEPLTEFLTLTDDLVMSALSPDVLRIQCAAPRDILLPDPDDCGDGRTIKIVNDNDGGGESLTIRDNADSTTIVTLAPGEQALLMKSFDKTVWILS